MTTTTQTPVAERHRAALLVRGQHRALDAVFNKEAVQPAQAAKAENQPPARQAAQPAR